MADPYRELAAFDDLAFAALKVSLSEPERTVIIDRLRQDWMTDVGVIGVLRRLQIDTQSIEAPAKLYWESRREALSPRIESIFASFLINLTSSIVYDVLKEFAASGYDVTRLLQERGSNLSTLAGFVGDFRVLTEHARVLMRLYRAKEDVGRANEVREIVEAVLSGKKLSVENPDADAAFNLFMSNIFPAARGVVKEELKKRGVFVADEADAVQVIGLPASSGFGIGVPLRWTGKTIPPGPPYILLIDSRAVPTFGKPDPLEAIEQSAAVVTWGGGMTSHVSVSCRSIFRAAVMVSHGEAEMLARKKHLIVDGTNGLIRSYQRRPGNDSVDIQNAMFSACLNTTEEVERKR